MLRVKENTMRNAGLLLGLLASLLYPHEARARSEWYRGLDLEQAVRGSDLILIARVLEVSEATTVSGGKAEITTQQIKFQPVRTLKGVFTRDQLQLTTNDLGGFNEPVFLERGQLRLLLLGRSHQGYNNQNRRHTLDSAVPALQNENDPLLATIKVLIAVSQQYDRAKKVALLVDGLNAAKGPAAVPLLLALRRRALLAAQTTGMSATVIRHLDDASPAVREAAADLLHALLEADYLEQKELRTPAVVALAALLQKPNADLVLRVSALEGLGAAGVATLTTPAAIAQLKLDKPRHTLAEQTAVVRAVGRLRHKDQLEIVATLLEGLPLDAPHELSSAAATSLIALDVDRAAKLIAQRIQQKVALGLTVEEEIGAIAELPAGVAATELLDVLKLDLSSSEKQAFARAAFRVADPRLVPALATMLHPRSPELRAVAFEALRKINTEDAAKAMLLHLKEEANLHTKLRIAEFLGRHGMRDGYPYAMEHLSEPGLVEEAVAALVAVRDPRSVPVLRDILKSSNDEGWNSEVIRALGALGEKEFSASFLEFVHDLKNPLAPAALVALGDLGEVKALPKVREGLTSRNDRIARASARAAAKLLAVTGVKADEVRDQLAALFADADARPDLRLAALDALVAVNDPRLDQALRTAVRNAGLEGSELMHRTEKLLRERKVKV